MPSTLNLTNLKPAYNKGMTTRALLPDELADFAQNEIALGPLDGRYRSYVTPLSNFLSEPALNRARIFVEIEWLIYLVNQQIFTNIPRFSAAEQSYLRKAVTEFGPRQIEQLAKFEAETRHDIKAVEYFLQDHLRSAAESLPESKLPQLTSLVHIFCTSEDINNLAYALCVHDAVHRVWLPAAQQLADQLNQMAKDHADAAMLGRTHGQPATPVTLGREMRIFAHRLERQLKRVNQAEFLGKLNGATGTWAAHRISLPEVNWPQLTRDFVESLGLTWNPLTTQIESHDWQVELYGTLAHVNRILHNLATDVWTYISLGYFHQSLSAQGSTGSSTMPHKVNPIRFENAEANLEISSALFETLSATLVTSRMQRDLTDSSTQRNISTAFGHSLLALANLKRGLAGLEVNRELMVRELDENWEILGEAVQQVMRVSGLNGAAGMDNPYERLKELTRDQKISATSLRNFVAKLDFSPQEQARLQALTPQSYLGYAIESAKNTLPAEPK